MTTLAIIGAGIAGRSLIYALARSQKNFSEIILFDSDNFAHACSLRSTAIVAPRGVTEGHSELGDLLVAGFQTFSQHVQNDLPVGVFPITQYNGAVTKLEQFKKRYPDGIETKTFASFSLKEEVFLAQEPAYLIDTHLYLQWLIEKSSGLNLKLKTDFVTSFSKSEKGIELRTQNNDCFLFDQVVFCGGSYNQLSHQKKAGRPVAGSFYEFSDINLNSESFSLTLEGDNFIYHSHSHKILIGSTTSDVIHEIAPQKKLAEVYLRLQKQLAFQLPPQQKAKVVTGMREKAAKRSPYLLREDNVAWLGGLYKNGYSLGLHLSLKLLELIH